MSHDNMVRVLKLHGFSPETNPYTMLEPGDAGYEAYETFYLEVGKRERYSMTAVMDWLGY